VEVESSAWRVARSGALGGQGERYSPHMNDLLGEAAAVVEIAAPTLVASRFALRQLRLFGTFEVQWFQLNEEDWFTAAEITDVEEFLADRDTRAMLSLLAVTLLTPESDTKEESIASLRETFGRLTKRWRANHSRNWLDRQDSIWISIRRIYDAATPAGNVLGEAALEFTDFVSTPIGRTSTDSSTAERHIERISNLCGDLQRVTSALETAAILKAALADAPVPPIITYASTTKSATFGDLYVARTLRDSETDAAVENLSLGKLGAPYRSVLHGAPGAGKSTFVRNLGRELALDEDGQPALVVTVRSYFQAAQSQTVVEYLHTSLRTSLNLELSEISIRDGLTLGLFVVIFDGLDEITDINLRIETVGRITSFAREYPVTSVLVTSRAIGYERAPLPSATFRTLVLDQYTEDQAREYVARWFTFMDRADLVVEFERESLSVADLKSNPLVLSLLCVLYRERGSIPRRRRDIYAACADLLFHTWDSHRHIDQPEELHANGDRIMQEIARWVYKSQTAQNGLSERVIQKTIGIYLHDHVGVEEGEARRRAGEFLEFCATRAWLLGTTGTQYGERVFGFTHRTFFEYFTAEAFSRSTSDPQEIARILLEANKRDATSVLPELLLQAFDEKVDRGAGIAFEHVCRLTEDELLILRLMEGVPLSTKVRNTGFDRVLELWRSKKYVAESAFVALLTLNPDARNHFVKDYLAEDSEESMQIFLAAWASLDLAGGTNRHIQIWGDIVSSRSSIVSTTSELWFGRSLRAWLWRNGYASDRPTDMDSAYLLPSASGLRVGNLWLGLELLAETPSLSTTKDAHEFFSSVLAAAKRTGYKQSSWTAHNLPDALVRRIDATPSLDTIAEGGSEDALWAYCYLMALVHEATRDGEDVGEAIRDSLLPVAQQMWEVRELALSEDGPNLTGSRGTSLRTRTAFPRWLREWTEGKRSFIADPDSEHNEQSRR
jgi:hypothetical protein